MWQKIEANGFCVRCQMSKGDENPEEVCMEDILGLMCTHPAPEGKQNEIDSSHQTSAYFRRTNLHASEDAFDIQLLVAQVEAEYLAQGWHAPPSEAGKPVPLLAHPLRDTDFAILTTKMGYYRGFPIILRASCAEEKEQWIETLRRVIKFESAVYLAPLGTFPRLRRQVRTLYTGPTTQVFWCELCLQREFCKVLLRKLDTRLILLRCVQLTVATLICTNFLVNIIEAQTQGSFENVLEVVDLFFTAVFSFELVVNLFASLFAEFFRDSWNYFDTIVVGVGLVTLVIPDLPGGSTLKLIRTFRVFRLFKRIPSLKHLVTSIFKAIPAMANAYVLMMILTSIYSILCVKFFSKLGPDQYELFGDFFGAMFSLWQIMTRDDWGGIVRDMMLPSGMPAGVALFFVSYQILITFTMINVVVCVLVGEFCGSGDASDETSNDYAPLLNPVKRYQQNNTSRLKSLLVDCLACHDLDAYDNMINQIWKSLCRFAGLADPDNEGTAITFEEMVIGLRELPYCPPVIFKWQDWSDLVQTNQLCNTEGLLTRHGFNDTVQFAIKIFGKKNLQVAIRLSSNGENDNEWSGETIRCLLFGIKSKAICIAQKALRQEQQILKSFRRQNADQTQDPNQTRFLKMRQLVYEFNKLHKRFTRVEENTNCASVSQDGGELCVYC